MIVLGYTFFTAGADIHQEAAALRDRMLSALCGIADPHVERAPGGKPYLADWREITFSVSHTGSLALCVLSFPGRADAEEYEVLLDSDASPEVGADAEVLRHVSHASRLRRIAGRFFPPEEARRLALLPDEAIPREFAAFWTLCESYVKMTGEGFGSGFAALDFTGIVSPCRTLRRNGEEYILRAAWREEKGKNHEAYSKNHTETTAEPSSVAHRG